MNRHESYQKESVRSTLFQNHCYFEVQIMANKVAMFVNNLNIKAVEINKINTICFTFDCRTTFSLISNYGQG